MSALDQAFIKAYAKDMPAVAAVSVHAGAVAVAAKAPAAANAARVRLAADSSSATQVIEQIYHDATLYRVDAPAANTARRVAVPVPHFQLPPRSSPRRNVRRSVLKLLGEVSQSATPMPVKPPARPASIVRALSDSTTTFYSDQPSARLARPARHAAPLLRPKQELAPEIITQTPHDEPLPVKAAPAFEPKLPPITPPPPPAPLNLVEELGPQIEVHGHWDSDSLTAAGSLVVLPEPADFQQTQPAPLVELRLDAMPQILEAPTAREPIAESITEPAATFRVDPPHAERVTRPHAKFQPQPEEQPAESPEETTAYFGDAAEDHDPAQSATHHAAAGDEDLSDLSFADLEPAAAAATIAAATQGEEELTLVEPSAEPLLNEPLLNQPFEEQELQAENCVPVWEVDRFQWPITVERLTADKEGYFAQAGERLVAAVGDGLRTLAVTGSRRGEGRTTLALCLARAAAKAGIQVAVINADFARPQLAGRIGLEISHGWQDAATGLIPLSEAAVRSLTDNITILPLETAAARSQLSLADPRVTATLRAAAATFELVLVDLGPLSAAEDELFPAGESCPFDAAIVVRDLRYASASESEGVGERLYAAGIEAVGVAENFVVEEEIPVTSV